MSSTSPLAAHRSSPTARPSSRRLTFLASASVASAGVGLASVGVWLDQAMLGVAGAAVAAVPSLWLALRTSRPAVATSSFPPTREWLADRAALSGADATAPTVSSESTASTAATVAHHAAPEAMPSPTSMTPAKDAVWAIPVAPYRPAIMPAPVRPALSAAPASQRGQSAARADAQAEPPTVSVVEPRRFAVADPPAATVPNAPVPAATEPAVPTVSAVPAARATPSAAPQSMPQPTAATAAARVAAPVDVREHSPRVDTAELQLIWDLGEAGEPPTTGPPSASRGRHVATTPVDHKPDRTPRADSPRRRARHRA